MKHFIYIEYKFSHVFDIEDSEHPNVEEIKGEIFLNALEDESIKIGEVELHYYNCSFADFGFNLYEAFDRSMNTINLGGALLDFESNYLKNEIEEQIGTSFNNSILVIHELMLYAKYRNKGYGKEIITGIENFNKGKCGYLALQSHPKQHDISTQKEKKFQEYQLDKLNSDSDKAQISLDLFYKKCGFIRVKGRESFFIKNIDPI